MIAKCKVSCQTASWHKNGQQQGKTANLNTAWISVNNNVSVVAHKLGQRYHTNVR